MQLGGLGEEEDEDEEEEEEEAKAEAKAEAEKEEGGTARIDEESVERWLEVGLGWVLAV